MEVVKVDINEIDEINEVNKVNEINEINEVDEVEDLIVKMKERRNFDTAITTAFWCGVE